MNKNLRNTIIFSLILLGALALTIFLFYISSFRTVTFDLVPDNLDGVNVYGENNREVGRLEADGSLRLQQGVYTYVPFGGRYSTQGIEFTVDSDEVITVNPDYSTEYRQEILQTETPAILDVINTAYSKTLQNFTINTGTIYLQGDWYATTITQNPLPGGQQGDVYRIVLQKVDDTWQIAAGPEIILSAPIYPDVPYEILKDINSR